MPIPFARYLSLTLLSLALVLPYAVVGHTYPIPTFYAEFMALALYLLTGAGVVQVGAVTWECFTGGKTASSLPAPGAGPSPVDAPSLPSNLAPPECRS